MGKAICKKEQMSNWERRPLRNSQRHYAALDAYVLVEIIHKLAEKGQELGYPIEKFIATLDNTDYIPTGSDSEETKEENGGFLKNKPSY